MLALRYHRYGTPDVLVVEDAPEPHAGPGQIRIAVRAASVNPFDWKVRAGYMDGIVPTTFPAIPGTDAAGVVDEVGEGVEGVAIGDEVFGLGAGTAAEYAILDTVAAKPGKVSFAEAAAFGLAAEAAARTLDRLTLSPGDTVLIDGAAGGVGSAMVQFARARGLTVIGTATERQHDYLRSLGATPTTYGEGLADRVSSLAPEGVAAAIDVVGHGSVPALIEITGDPRKVATVADFTVYGLGVHVADTSTGRAAYALGEAARLHAEGAYVIHIERAFPLAEGSKAHALSEDGHVRGKVVLTIH